MLISRANNIEYDNVILDNSARETTSNRVDLPTNFPPNNEVFVFIPTINA